MPGEVSPHILMEKQGLCIAEESPFQQAEKIEQVSCAEPWKANENANQD